MNRNVKKFCSVICACSLVLCVFATTASAEEGAAVFSGNPDIVIQVESAEEFEALSQKIDAHNQRAEELWQQAVKQAELEQQLGLVDFSRPAVSPRTYGVESVNGSMYWMNYATCSYGFSVTFDKVQRSNGPAFTTVYSRNAYANSANSSVSLNDSRSTIIDSQRTIACNYSCLLGVLDHGQWYYKTVAFYVEFYVSGGGTIY